MVTKKVIFYSLIIAIIYTLLTVYMMNGVLVKDTLFGNFPLDYKFDLMIALLAGMWTAMTGAGLLILITTAVLTGINLTLVFQRFVRLGSGGKLHLVVGGSSILGIVGSGCAACGLPIISFLGLSGSLIYLPFRGMELSYIAIILLITSIFFMLRKTEVSCKIESSFTPSGSLLEQY